MPHKEKKIIPEALMQVREEVLTLLSNNIHQAIKHTHEHHYKFTAAELSAAMFAVMYEFGFVTGLDENDPDIKPKGWGDMLNAMRSDEGDL